MLHGDAAAQRGDAIDGFVGDGLGVVEEPVQAGQRRVAMDFLEDIQRARDGLVIGGMQAPGPAVLRQHAHHFLQLAFHFRRHVRPLDAEVLEIGGREHQHLAGAVVTEVVRALLVLHAGGPVEEVLLLLLWLLREQVVGQPHGHLIVVGQPLDDGIVVGIVLEAAAGVDHAGHAQTVHPRMKWRVELSW